MPRPVLTMVTIVALLLSTNALCEARGGGGFRGAGGGGRGFGGGRPAQGGFSGRTTDFGGRSGGFNETRGFNSGRNFSEGRNFGGTRDFNETRNLGERSLNGSREFGPSRDAIGSEGRQNRLNQDRAGDLNRSLPTDLGFGHAATRDFLPAGHATQAWDQGSLRNRGTEVRNNFNDRHTFNEHWWNDHPGAWFAAGWGARAAWGWTAWPVLGGWYGWGTTTAPMSYDYGTNVVYQDDQVYYDNTPAGTAEDYYQQATQIASAAQNTDPNEGEWKPLGVFGLIQEKQTTPSVLLQLATNKQGDIAGNFSDSLSGNTLKIQGAVDPKTQRAAWTVGDNKDTVYEAGIYNLTQEEAPVLVHFGKQRTQQWLLVRMQEPPQTETSGKDDSSSESQ